MTPDLSKASVYSDLQGLTGLKAAAKSQSPEAVRAVAQQFEALFLQMVLKSMRDASEGDPLFDSDQGDLYRDMYDKQLALDISTKGRGVGLAEALVRQLQPQLGVATEGPAESKPLDMSGVVRRGDTFRLQQQTATAKAVASNSPAAERIAESPEAFVRGLWPLAEKAAARIGVAPEALIAQAALETGWGKSVIRHADGNSSHNLFNIKADRRWDGESVTKRTLEYRDGIAAKETAQFRAYSSFAESFDDYVDFLQANPRYTEALSQAGDRRRYIQELQRAGYATDPGYSTKINEIMQREVFADARAALKNSAGGTLS